MKKILAGLLGCLMFVFVENCNSSQYINDSTVKEIGLYCQSFVQAISTKDTLKFVKLTDVVALTANLNKWMNQSVEIRKDDIYFPFFLVFSPQKIKYEELLEKRKSKKFFNYFKIIKMEMIDEKIVGVAVEWKEELQQNRMTRKMQLILRNDVVWKVINAKWEPLSN